MKFSFQEMTIQIVVAIQFKYLFKGMKGPISEKERMVTSPQQRENVEDNTSQVIKRANKQLELSKLRSYI